jgi:hypothetical protein
MLTDCDSDFGANLTPLPTRSQRVHSRKTSTHRKFTTMPKLSVENVGEFEIPQGKRLINALADEAGTDQLHSCVANLLS